MAKYTNFWNKNCANCLKTKIPPVAQVNGRVKKGDALDLPEKLAVCDFAREYVIVKAISNYHFDCGKIGYVGIFSTESLDMFASCRGIQAVYAELVILNYCHIGSV